MNVSRKLFFVSCVAFSGPALAVATATGEAQFRAAQEALGQKNYALCADLFYQAKISGIDQNSQANLFLAFCQEKLGNKKFAALNLNQVDTSDLKSSEQEVYDTVAQKIEAELDALNPYYSWVMPFVAFGSYSSNSSKSSVKDFGASGGVSHGAWSLSLAGDYLAIAFRSASLTAYHQTQAGFGAGRSFGTSFWARLNATYINTNASTLGSTTVLGGTAGFIPTLGTELSVDYQHSSYPGLSLGALTAHQVTGALDQRLWADVNNLLHAKGGVQFISPSAPSTYDSTTAFTLESSYVRYVLDVEFRHKSWVLAAQYWAGAEAFGVRNQGGLLYNALEKHKSGAQARVGYYVTPATYLQASYALEKFNASSVDSTASVGAVMATFNF